MSANDFTSVITDMIAQDMMTHFKDLMKRVLFSFTSELSKTHKISVEEVICIWNKALPHLAYGTSSNKVLLSPDGINWTPINITANVNTSWSVVRWSPELGIFCALARNTTPNVMISRDGKNWEYYSTPSAIDYRNLAWSPQLRIFVAVSQTGTNRLAFSYDGKVWYEENLTSIVNSNIRGIVWSPELGIF
jgi:hypothetical protein